MNETYIKLFRKMLSWEWYTDANTFRVFMHILLKANYKPSRYKGHEIGAGECVFGYSSCARDLKLSVHQVRTAIEHLKLTGEVTIRTTNKFSVVTVAKWEFWQIDEGEVASKTAGNAANKRQTSGTQVAPSKESKNSKKVRSNSIGTDLYDSLPEELRKTLTDFEEMRKRIRKPITTDRARQLLLNKLNELSGGDAQTAVAILEQSIMNSWQGIFALHDTKPQVQNPFSEMLRTGDY